METAEIWETVIEERGMQGQEKMTPTLRGILRQDEPMSRHSSWRAGGMAKRYYIPADEEDLSAFLASLDASEPVLWLGLGSNLLVRDGGFQGTVVAVSGVLEKLETTAAGQVTAGAGLSCAKLARYTVHHAMTGAEFLAGIPGTVGGALAMNAGAFGSATWGIATGARTIQRDGRIRYRSREELKPAYRHVDLPEGEWFLSGEFRLASGDKSDGLRRIRDLLRKRSQAQPIGEPSCGSVFRNPPSDSAGRLIDACGLKGLYIGKARVSEKHANFIINEGNAQASEIEQLIESIQKRVLEATGILLEPEVRIVGQEQS